MNDATNTSDASNIEKILVRVRKMMTLAHDAGATEGERDNALRMAHATLAKYNLTMAQAESAGRAEEKRANTSQFGRGYAWARRTAQAVAHLFFCSYFFVPGKNADRCFHHFIGRESNLITAQEMAHYVVESILSEANKRRVREQQSWTWHTAFCKGAAEQVIAKCRELRLAAEQASSSVGTGTSIVLASFYAQEKAANDRYLAEQLKIQLKHSKSREHATGGDGYYSGREYGKGINLHRQVSSASSSNNPRLK